MLELERNSPVDAATLTEFFARCGWHEPDASSKLEWALAASEEWISCKLDGQLIGFGRSCRLDPVRRVVFDVMVDPRFEHSGLKGEIVRLLTASAGRLEEVSVFTERMAHPPGFPPTSGGEAETQQLPTSLSRAYLGKQSPPTEGEG